MVNQLEKTHTQLKQKICFLQHTERANPSSYFSAPLIWSLFVDDVYFIRSKVQAPNDDDDDAHKDVVDDGYS